MKTMSRKDVSGLTADQLAEIDRRLDTFEEDFKSYRRTDSDLGHFATQLNTPRNFAEWLCVRGGIW